MPTQRTQPIASQPETEFAAEVCAGLSKPGQKELPSKYLYDEVGTALFEVITLLPEYGLSRAGARLLRRYAGDMVDRLLRRPASARPEGGRATPRLRSPQAAGRLVVAELGSGNGKKTRWLLEALTRRQPTKYFPIDISATALARCQLELGQIDSVSIVGFERAYLDGLLEVAARREPGEHLLVLFLGSTIGNFDRPAGEEFLREVRRTLAVGDALLLATDLVKPIPQVLLAYHDPAGVTAAFNLNLLARINRELNADFDLRQFRHVVRYNESKRRIEMHLEAARDVTATIRLPRRAKLTVRLRKGETIWTESSYKYDVEEVVQMAGRAGFRCEAQWVDREWPFAQSLLVVR